jgi:hypothetical protein
MKYFITLLLGLCLIVVFFINFNNDINEIYKDEMNKNNYQYDLVQISNTKDINGHMSSGFFCGYGYIEEKPYYYVYIKKDGGMQLLKLGAENYDSKYYDYTITIYQDSKNPYIKSIYIKDSYRVNSYDKRMIEIHIPPDSMVQNIDINSENFK